MEHQPLIVVMKLVFEENNEKLMKLMQSEMQELRGGTHLMRFMGSEGQGVRGQVPRPKKGQGVKGHGVRSTVPSA
ncbi:MAG TPA: hypothetical protein VKZ77_12680 [Bacillaceae bacterium]|nr:hypothetical protein [Bacillaceae bacterium]